MQNFYNLSWRHEELPTGFNIFLRIENW